MNKEESDAAMEEVEEFLSTVPLDVYGKEGISFGLGPWAIHLVNSSDDNGETLIQLFGIRKDLLLPILLSNNWVQLIRNLSPLQEWLLLRDYHLLISGENWRTRFIAKLLGIVGMLSYNG